MLTEIIWLISKMLIKKLCCFEKIAVFLQILSEHLNSIVAAAGTRTGLDTNSLSIPVRRRLCTLV